MAALCEGCGGGRVLCSHPMQRVCCEEAAKKLIPRFVSNALSEKVHRSLKFGKQFPWTAALWLPSLSNMHTVATVSDSCHLVDDSIAATLQLYAGDPSAFEDPHRSFVMLSKLDVFIATLWSMVLNVARHPVLDHHQGPAAIVICATQLQCEEAAYVLSMLAEPLRLVVHNLFEPCPPMPPEKRADVVVCTPSLLHAFLPMAPPLVKRSNEGDAGNFVMWEYPKPVELGSGDAIVGEYETLLERLHRSMGYRSYSRDVRQYGLSRVARVCVVDIEGIMSCGFFPLIQSTFATHRGSNDGGDCWASETLVGLPPTTFFHFIVRGQEGRAVSRQLISLHRSTRSCDAVDTFFADADSPAMIADDKPLPPTVLREAKGDVNTLLFLGVTTLSRLVHNPQLASQLPEAIREVCREGPHGALVQVSLVFLCMDDVPAGIALEARGEDNVLAFLEHKFRGKFFDGNVVTTFRMGCGAVGVSQNPYLTCLLRHPISTVRLRYSCSYIAEQLRCRVNAQRSCRHDPEPQRNRGRSDTTDFVWKCFTCEYGATLLEKVQGALASDRFCVSVFGIGATAVSLRLPYNAKVVSERGIEVTDSGQEHRCPSLLEDLLLRLCRIAAVRSYFVQDDAESLMSTLFVEYFSSFGAAECVRQTSLWSGEEEGTPFAEILSNDELYAKMRLRDVF